MKYLIKPLKKISVGYCLCNQQCESNCSGDCGSKCNSYKPCNDKLYLC